MDRGSRGTFMEVLEELASKDERLMLITCDVGFSYLETFSKKYPKQYRNLGVTEQFATGYCAGLAAKGKKPYFYSMIPFVCMRNYEQVRNDVCYSNANVKLIGIQGSVGYKFLGSSHNIEKNEDRKILKGLPNLRLMFPRTPRGIKHAIVEAYRDTKPYYIRLC